jgi:hypothetical protein
MKTIDEKKNLWTKPQLKTITADELKKIAVVSTCSEYQPACHSAFFK